MNPLGGFLFFFLTSRLSGYFVFRDIKIPYRPVLSWTGMAVNMLSPPCYS